MQDVHNISRRALPKEDAPGFDFALLRGPPDGLQVGGSDPSEEANPLKAADDLEEFRHSAYPAVRAFCISSGTRRCQDS